VALSVTWFRVGSLEVPFSLRLDGLQGLMVIVVAGVSVLVHLFSVGYMHGDRDLVLYFAELSLFSAAMLLLVLADDFYVLYMAWELVGASSYLLISHYFERPEAAAAGKKAFLTTRIGDVGLLLGIFALVWLTGSLDFHTVFAQATEPGLPGAWRVAVPLLIFMGAVGKSAQLPLHVWLPDAMEGPTPVSALIHAATMVAAGVYLVARTYPIFVAAPQALAVVGWIGALTALMAATVGLTQRDIKKVLAYSTISQLGFMMTALGAGVPAAAMFQLFTHAWFKALLFLAAGSVIHATSRQVVDELGGLGRRMPITAVTFAAGALALAGIPPFAGFWSKEEILGSLAGGHPAFLGMLLVASFFTAFYISRVFFVVFLGPEIEAEAPVHESGPVMWVPLAVLALAALGAGFWGAGFLGYPLQKSLGLEAGGVPAGGPVWVTAVAVALGLAGIVLAWLTYGRRPARVPAAGQAAPGQAAPGQAGGATAAGRVRPGRPAFDARLEDSLGWTYRMIDHAYYVDAFYSRYLVAPFVGMARFLARAVDAGLIDGTVNGVAWLVTGAAVGARRLQTGRVRDYVAAVAVGVFVVAALVVGALR
jgi:NADH-quinone oxidoreductase subunit L